MLIAVIYFFWMNLRPHFYGQEQGPRTNNDLIEVDKHWHTDWHTYTETLGKL